MNRMELAREYGRQLAKAKFEKHALDAYGVGRLLHDLSPQMKRTLAGGAMGATVGGLRGVVKGEEGHKGQAAALQALLGGALGAGAGYAASPSMDVASRLGRAEVEATKFPGNRLQELYERDVASAPWLARLLHRGKL